MNERGGVQVRILGNVEVVDSAGAAPLAPQLRRLLAILAVADGEVVSADRLAEYIAEGNATGSTVRTAVSRLRKVLGDRIEAADGGYRLVLGDGELDAGRFEELRSAASGDADALQAALALWRGPALGDLADAEWAVATAARLDAARADATEDLAAAFLAAGRAGRALEILEPHLLEYPYSERPVALLMDALGSAGRTAEALRAYQRFRTTLRDDTGLDPSPELQQLETTLLTDDSTPPASPAGGPPDGGLPNGTVTFLFTDIENSTERWQDDEMAMAAAVADHDEVIRSSVERRGGYVFKHTGDGICAVFTSAPAAVEAAVDAQASLGLPVRIGVHTGNAELRDGDYFGTTLNRIARVTDAGHGGQVLLTDATFGLLDGVSVVDLGEHQLKGLNTPERLYQLGTDSFAPLRAATERKGNLPREVNEFVGRGDEVAEIVDLVGEHRLVTLLGVGGTGKTRLAVEAASRLAPAFPDGCWLAELARISVPEAAPAALCTGLGIPIPESGDVVEYIVRRIHNERRLVVVDNCEHLLDAAAEVIEQILAGCPHVSIIATSREPLMVTGERLVPTPGLTSAEAVELFVKRAESEAASLVLDSEQIESISQLCDRLDRLPLAIELAASRLRTMTPLEMIDRLEQRFRLLVGGRRSRMERHQTMRGTVDWSYELCDETEQRVFDRLSVFVGEFDAEAARAVSAWGDVDELDADDALGRLVDRSLVQRRAGDDRTSRYRLLETMRAYGHEQLVQRNEAERAREAHARHVSERVGQLGLRSLGPDEQHVYAQLRPWAADALAAFDWSIEEADWSEAYGIACSFYFAAPGVTFSLIARARPELADVSEAEALASPAGFARFSMSIMVGSPVTPEEVVVGNAYLRSSPILQSSHWTLGLLAMFGCVDDDLTPLKSAEDWLARLVSAPAAIRFYETVSAADAAVNSTLEYGDVLTRYEHARDRALIDWGLKRLHEAEQLAEELDSDLARTRCVASALLFAELSYDVGEIVDRARHAIDQADNPNTGHIYLASRFLRLISKNGDVSGDDLLRPLRWTQQNTIGIAMPIATLATVIALLDLGNEPLAKRVASALAGPHERQFVAELYRHRLTPSVFDQLSNQPHTSTLDEIMPDLEQYAQTLDAGTSQQ